MIKAEIADLTPEGYPVITRKVWRLGESTAVKLKTGSTSYYLGGIENIHATIIDSVPGVEFKEPGVSDEIFVYVLEGLILYEGGRCVRKDEAVFHCPNVPYQGKYAGTETIRALVLKVTPKLGSKPPDPALMRNVIRLADIKPVKLPFGTGTERYSFIKTENLHVSMGVNWPVMEFMDPGHWDPELVFGIEGKLEYFDGRDVRPGDLITNGYNVPHPGRYATGKAVRILECSTSLYRVGAGFQPDGVPLPGYINAWKNQTLKQLLSKKK